MRRAGWWALFCLCVLVGLAALALAVGAAETASDRGNSVGGAVAAVIILVLVAAILGRVAWVSEHRARGRRHYPKPPASPPRPVPEIRDAGNRRRARHTPTTFLVQALIFSIGSVILVISAVVVGGEWRQSVATQEHGIAMRATVVVDDVVSHSTRSGHYDTSHLTVRYDEPVDGVGEALIKVPRLERDDVVGTVVDVRVDRSQPTHAELAGVFDTGQASFVLLIIFAVVAAGIASVLWRSYVRLHRAVRAYAA